MKYNIIYTDFPWLYNKRNNPKTKFGLGMHRYPGMTKQEILDLDISSIVADNCALFMWVTSPAIRKDYIPIQIAFEYAQKYGFRYVNKAFTWIKVDKNNKPRFLPGHYTGSNSEDCLLFIKGKMDVKHHGINQVVISQLEEHSKKPDEIRNRIVKLFGDLPRVEMFARQQVLGWDSFGLEVENSIEL